MIRYREFNPELAAKVVNTLAQAYIVENVQQNRAEASSTRTFVESQLPKMEQRLRDSERRLREFKERYGSVALPEEQQAVVKQLAEFKSEQAQAAVKLAEAQTRAGAIASRMGGLSEKEALVAGALSSSDGMSELRKDLVEVESKLALARAQYQDNYPDVDRLIKQRNALRALLKTEAGRLLGQPGLPDSLVDASVAAEAQAPATKDNLPRLDLVRQKLLKDLVDARVEELAARTRTDALNSVSERYSSQVAAMPRLEETQRQLERQVEADSAAYKLLQTKFHEYRILEAQNIGNAELIEPAVAPELPAWPSPLLNLGAGALLGAILAMLVAYGREFFDDSLQTVEEATSLLGTPLLGTIPRWTGAEGPGLVAQSDPLSPMSEAYRSVRTYLKFLSAESPLTAVVFTSASPQEGKSTTVANLAIVSAQSGARVLLIDADLRKPRQHKLWEVSNQQGLSTLLTGEGNWRDLLVQPPGLERLSLLTAGPMPPNPLALLESRQLPELLAQWRAEFDLILFDTPPVTAAADALALTALSDGLVLVVRPTVANKRILVKVRESLKRPGIRLLGQIVNGTIAANEGHSEYYYYNRYQTRSTDSLAVSTKNGSGNGRAYATNGNGKGSSRKWYQIFSARQDSKSRP